MTALSSISSSVTKAREQLSARATNIAKALIDVKKRKEAASRDGEESMKRITTFFKEMTDAVIARNEECVLDLTSQIASATDSLDSHEAGLLVDKDDVEQALLRLANVERGPLSLLQEGGDEVARVWAAYYTKATPSLPYETPLSFASSTGVLQAIRRAGQVGHGAAAVTSVRILMVVV
jgi:seryl-tRNA synthetase